MHIYFHQLIKATVISTLFGFWLKDIVAACFMFVLLVSVFYTIETTLTRMSNILEDEMKKHRRRNNTTLDSKF